MPGFRRKGEWETVFAAFELSFFCILNPRVSVTSFSGFDIPNFAPSRFELLSFCSLELGRDSFVQVQDDRPEDREGVPTESWRLFHPCYRVLCQILEFQLGPGNREPRKCYCIFFPPCSAVGGSGNSQGHFSAPSRACVFCLHITNPSALRARQEGYEPQEVPGDGSQVCSGTGYHTRH